MELTTLTGTNINNWQDDATANNEAEISAAAQYAALLPQVREEMENKEDAPVGIILFSVAMLGGAGLMRWKGLI